MQHFTPMIEPEPRPALRMNTQVIVTPARMGRRAAQRGRARAAAVQITAQGRLASAEDASFLGLIANSLGYPAALGMID
jgi:hypothetical protein